MREQIQNEEKPIKIKYINKTKQKNKLKQNKTNKTKQKRKKPKMK